MKPIVLRDNSRLNEEQKCNPIVQKFVNKNLGELNKENFIIFPFSIAESKDIEERNYIFESKNNEVYTCNIIGVIKYEQNEIRILSRFSQSDDDNYDYFIRYMLSKILHYNVIKNKTNVNEQDKYYDLLVFLFPFYFMAATRKGIYKEYVHRKYNDLNIRGPIDIKRHIHKNIPFTKSVAYNTREFSHNNRITQLIRHTIEKINRDYHFDYSNESLLKENINQIKQITSNYSVVDLSRVLFDNIYHPLRHSYYHEYYELQQLCIKILKSEKVGFGKENKEINGIIIDVAWLWEEYLNTILKNDFIHASNKLKKNGISLFKDKTHIVYPDFYLKDSPLIVMDAKYKMLENDKSLYINDLYQIISYIHVLKSKIGIILYPHPDENNKIYIGELKGSGGIINKISFKIPKANNYIEFIKKIEISENDLIKIIEEIKK